jgi:hypothetical protein
LNTTTVKPVDSKRRQFSVHGHSLAGAFTRLQLAHG